jgi:tetratricopeptide (TPR) repeat protein
MVQSSCLICAAPHSGWERLVEVLKAIDPSTEPKRLFRPESGSTFGELPRYVRVSRRNRLAQAFLWYRDEAATSLSKPSSSTIIDERIFQKIFGAIVRYEAEWDEFFRSRRIEPLQFVYEDMSFEWNNVGERLAIYLNVPPPPADIVPLPPVESIEDAVVRSLKAISTDATFAADLVENASTVQFHVRKGSEAFARKELGVATEHFRRAVEWDWLSHGAVHNLAVAMATQGRHAEAIPLFRRAASIEPNAFDTQRNLGLALAQTGAVVDAEAAYRRAVEIRPHSADLHFELAQFLRSSRRPEDAIREYEETLRLKADHADAYYGIGICSSDLKRSADAQRAYEAALRIRPKFAEVLNNLGVVFEEKGQGDQAKQSYYAALAERPGWPEALNNLGVVLAGEGNYEEAEKHYRQALAAAPDSASVLNNLGNTLRSQGKLDEAVEVLRRACELRPHYSEAYNNLGIALMNQGLPKEAIAHYNQALYFVPDYPEPHLNRSLAWLSLSDFDNGWVEYEWRWRGKNFGSRDYRQPRWDGGDVRRKTVFIYAEQGMGDTLQFIRYASLIKERGAHVVAQVQNALLPLFRSLSGVDRWIGSDAPPPDSFDVHAPLMSLPGVFKTSSTTIPASIPYLSVGDDVISHWREQLAEFKGFRVGIAWQGNPQYRGDRMRSPPLKHFSSAAKVPGVRFISLQKHHGLEQLAGIADDFEVHQLDGLDETSGPFIDTAAVMKCLDLVIASDSAIVHLAGALGVPVWVPLPFAADWRWFRNREDSPWYPTMRLFRQSAVGDWETVFERITDTLRTRAISHAARDRSTSERRLVCEIPSFQQGIAFAKEGKLTAAEACLRRAVDEDPSSAVAAHNLGAVAALQRKFSDAVEFFRRAIALAPEYGEAHGNLGLAYLDLGRTNDAIFEFQAALKFGANAAAMHNNLGAAMMDSGRSQDAVAAYRQALLLSPNFAEAHLNLARGLLSLGNFEEGWLEYEWRRRCRGFRVRNFSQPAWAGEALNGRAILLHDDAPIEDFLQLLRYAPSIADRGGRVIVSCPESWASLLSHCRGVEIIAKQTEPLPSFQRQAIVSGLPWIFRTTLDTIPASVPYLDIPEEHVASARAAFAKRDGLKVALVRPAYDRQLQRADFSDLAALLRNPKVCLVRLPVWHESAATDVSPIWVDSEKGLATEPLVTNDPTALAIWMRAADVVITADGPECHIAGACGAAVRLVLDGVCNWRWMLNREDSPWYPQMKIRRRGLHESQSSLYSRICAEISQHVST